MEKQDFIPEIEASLLAGVSTSTLSRFVEAGYLRTLNDNQGFKNYSKTEICQLFAIDPLSPANDSYLKSSIEISNPEYPEENNYRLNKDTEYKKYESDSSFKKIDGQKEKTYWAETISAENQYAKTANSEIVENIQTSAEPANGSHISDTATPSKQEKEDNKKTEQYYKDKLELTRLRNITVMQDKVIELRENEITELRKDTEWLRTRIEKLEDKAERDQLLLLNETQTIRKLININNQRRNSTFRNALEWLGLVPQNQVNQIEIKSKQFID